MIAGAPSLDKEGWNPQASCGREDGKGLGQPMSSLGRWKSDWARFRVRDFQLPLFFFTHTVIHAKWAHNLFPSTFQEAEANSFRHTKEFFPNSQCTPLAASDRHDECSHLRHEPFFRGDWEVTTYWSGANLGVIFPSPIQLSNDSYFSLFNF